MSASDQAMANFRRADRLIKQRGARSAVVYLLELLRACHDISTAGSDSELANKIRETIDK